MAEFDRGFKIVAQAAGRDLTRLAGLTVQKWEPVSDTLQATERLADRAFRAEGRGRRFVVYFEAFTQWVESALWNMLAKSGLLSERERLPTRTLAFILTAPGYRPQNGTFRLEADEGEPTQQLWFREVCLWQQEPEPWWERSPGLMALYPLCRYEGPLPDAVAHAADAIQKRELDSARRADLLTTLGFFGRLKDRGLNVTSIIGREQMKDSPFYQELLEEGEQIGRRKDILEAVEIRFGKPAAREFEGAVNRVANLEQLTALHRLAVKGRVTQFRRALADIEK